MSAEPAPAREISLNRLFPWLRLFRALGVSFDPKKLFLAALGLLLVRTGWSVLGSAFSDARLRTTTFVRPGPLFSNESGTLPGLELGGGLFYLAEPIMVVIGPFLDVFSTRSTGPVFLHALLAAVWAVAVWGIVGGAIARIAVVQIATGERMGMRAALRFALGKIVPLVLSPLSPLVGVAIAAVPCLAIGLLYRVPGEVGRLLAGILLLLPLLLGLLMTLIVLGLAAGWPLINAAVAAEAQDGFDALSRAYAYVYQRPGRYAAYAGLAWVLGIAGLIVVSLVAFASVSLAEWSLSWTAPLDPLGALFQAPVLAQPTPPQAAHAFWLRLVQLLSQGWVYAYFWSASVMVYLQLRRDVDGNEWHQVALPPRALNPLWPGAEPLGAKTTSELTPVAQEGHS